MLTVDIAVNTNRIFQIAAVNVGAEPGENPVTGLCRYDVTATEIYDDSRRCIPATLQVLHHRSHGPLLLVATIIAALTAEVTS
jgi:hypothetical protein